MLAMSLVCVPHSNCGSSCPRPLVPHLSSINCLLPSSSTDAHKTGVAQEAAKGAAAKVAKGLSAQEARQILHVDPQASWVDVTKVCSCLIVLSVRVCHVKQQCSNTHASHCN